MRLLEQEIKDYNGLCPVTRPRWLSSRATRAAKKHGSVVVSFEIKSEAERALRNRLYIAGISMRTIEYIPAKLTYQCQRCLGYGHSEKCYHREQKCSICAKGHLKVDHFCSIYRAKGEKCPCSKPSY